MTVTQLLRTSFDRFASREAVDGIKYEELGRRAEVLSKRLQNAGVKPGERVLLARENGVEGIVEMLGILLAGGTVVPVDPRSPEARRNRIRKDCRAVVVLGKELERGISSPSEDLAMILYTSGSTGEPKGVCLTHTNLLHFIEWTAREFGLTSEDRVSSHAPFHFDLSIFDLFSTFLVGGTVVPVPKTASLFPLQLGKFLEQKKITVWYSVPFALASLAERGGLAEIDHSLRLVMFAGEIFPLPSLRKLRAALPDVELVNLFGPTETNVSTFHRVRPQDLEKELPVGRPAPGFDWKIQNGEFVVRGPGVMRGYWGQEPISGWYKTGDLMEEKDGLLWYRGRKDRMIKVRGFRIEPGEVEAQFRRDPRIREVAVYAVPDLMGQKALAAALVLQEGTAKAILAELAQRLPSYMIPTKVKEITQLPRTATGKVDYASFESPAACESLSLGVGRIR